MKKLISILMLLSMLHYAKAQSSETDSLKHLITTNIDDTTRVMVLEGLSFAYQYSYPDSALQYALSGLDLARKINFVRGEAFCINALGNVYLNVGNYPRALELYVQALKIREELNEQREIAVTFSNIGTVYSEQGDDRQALEYILKTKMVDESIKDSAGLLIDLFNIGALYHKLKNDDSALYYQRQALKVAFLVKDEDYIGAIMNAFGDIYKSRNSHLTAKDYYRKAIYYATAVKDHDIISSANYGMATVFKESGILDSSIFYAKTALASAKEASFLKQEMDAGLLLSVLFKTTKQFDSALFYHEYSMAVKDSLFNITKLKQIQNLAYNEKLRQEEIAQQKLLARIERRDSLQLTGITIFILLFLFSVMLLGRRKKHPKFTEFLAVLSLLLLFEFISFLIHPYIGKVTHHIPVYYLLISVIVAASLARVHHFTTELIKGKVFKREW